MSAKRFNIGEFEVIAQPDLRISRDSEGKFSGSRSFLMRKEAKDSDAVHAKFARGVTLVSLCPDLGPYWSFLEIKEVEFEDEKGGYCRAFVTVDGYTAEGEFGFDREKTYSLSGVLTEKPIIEHPEFIAEIRDVSDSATAALVGEYHGTAKPAPGDETDFSSPEIIDIASDESLITLTTSDYLKWHKIIYRDRIRSFPAPTFEWTLSAANAGGLTDSEVGQLGLYDATPDGSPPEPTSNGFWILVSADEERGENSSSYQLTWRWIEGDIADEPFATLYNYTRP